MTHRRPRQEVVISARSFRVEDGTGAVVDARPPRQPPRAQACRRLHCESRAQASASGLYGWVQVSLAKTRSARRPPSRNSTGGCAGCTGTPSRSGHRSAGSRRSRGPHRLELAPRAGRRRLCGARPRPRTRPRGAHALGVDDSAKQLHHPRARSNFSRCAPRAPQPRRGARRRRVVNRTGAKPVARFSGSPVGMGCVLPNGGKDRCVTSADCLGGFVCSNGTCTEAVGPCPACDAGTATAPTGARVRTPTQGRGGGAPTNAPAASAARAVRAAKSGSARPPAPTGVAKPARAPPPSLLSGSTGAPLLTPRARPAVTSTTTPSQPTAEVPAPMVPARQTSSTPSSRPKTTWSTLRSLRGRPSSRSFALAASTNAR